MNQDVSRFLNTLKTWKDELHTLHEIILECGLEAEFKWMHPCYTNHGKNIVLIHGFKAYCALLFPKGALLKDTEQLLVQQTKNVQSGRQIRFTHLSEIKDLKPILKQYINEAISIEKSGLRVTKIKISDHDLPLELQQEFESDANFKNAFYALTPGRQRGYLLHFNAPKQSKTKQSRIKKNKMRIMDGYGFNDCTCGLSQRPPNCDGSHKQLELT
ncbi:uncharacterized protein YdeI (YjbR/CyaY-like superfamily) [Gelidibacter sediminis]|uniref:Uncharacterized protein YdeI (YjbR/CyaY-like superfamily) n=1 Tax=Gelidibacter sediminis TaxID=1608710 RepID=A0A4R7PXT5_9FLAO|nr:DUF1801 domain-containing protein [Gelidibacter sediminis]TDU39783.1 uncharacterized protein YdeI (YjbR/CyaY-like superfamily) [Gelidibacter sediminis]